MCTLLRDLVWMFLKMQKKHSASALPQLLKITSDMSDVSSQVFYDVRQTIEDVIGEDAIDGRLMTQYSLNIAFSNKVKIYF